MKIIAYLRGMVARRIAVIFLTLLILFADSGQMIYAHTCLKSNHTSLRLFSPGSGCCAKKEVIKRTCCAKRAAEQNRNCALGKLSCCSVSAKYVKQSFPSNEQKFTTVEIQKSFPAEITLFSAFVNNLSQEKTLFATVPLPLSKGDIRFTQVFRI